MIKILVIEPHQMLQHAFAMVLAPEYQIQVLATVPDTAAENPPDLVIIDAAALRERDSLGARELNALESWRSPVIWIDANALSPAPAADNALRLKWPLDREAFKKAVADCVGKIKNASGQTPIPGRGTAAMPPEKLPPREPGASQATGHGEKHLIDLVDVVD